MYTYVPNLPRIQIIIEKKGGGEGRGKMHVHVIIHANGNGNGNERFVYLL